MRRLMREAGPMNAGPERMAEMVTMLTAVSEVLAALTVRLSTAAADEVPALAAEAKTTMARLVKGCADTASLQHLPPEDAATVRDELLSLGRTLEAEIAAIVKLRWTLVTGGGASLIRH
jgi:phage host-nuclease inhibitor protein Gam